MGELREIFDAMKEHNKEVREYKRNKYEPLLIKIGAVEKSDGVYQYEDWLLYPTKGFAMNKYNSKRRKSIEAFIKEINK